MGWRYQTDFEAHELAVRQVLAIISMHAKAHDLPPDLSEDLQLVLAEVLNNVVEHAYAHQGYGWVRLTLAEKAGGVRASILDEGCAMPDHKVPSPARHSLNGPLSDLPEGGFGWALIHDLAKDLKYRRKGNRNHLSFAIPPKKSLG